MPTKAFEHAISFYQVPGQPVSFPLVTVNLLQPSGNRVSLPLLFDTGASSMVLRHDLYPILGLTSWDSGEPVSVDTAGGVAPVTAYKYQATIEFLGVTVDCPILLQQLPPNPLWMGLFGREQIFNRFGFGFWESSQELFITTTP
jgi:hypothetical protein